MAIVFGDASPTGNSLGPKPLIQPYFLHNADALSYYMWQCEDVVASTPRNPEGNTLNMPPCSFRRFLFAEDGNASIEFAVLLPAFLGLIVFAADTATIFTRQSSMWSVSQQTARIVSRHGLDAEGAEQFASELLRYGSYKPDVSVTVDDDTQIVTVEVTAKSAELAPFGMLSRTLADEVSVSVSQALEPT